MQSHERPSRWLSRPSRRRTDGVMLVACCLTGLAMLFFSTNKIARQADTSIHSSTRRGLEVQVPLNASLDEQCNGLLEHERSKLKPPRLEEGGHVADDVIETESELQPQSQLRLHSLDQTANPNWISPPGSEAFPSYDKYIALIEQAESLPDLIYVPFEDAVREDTLEGWEAEWLLNVTYDAQRWGLFKEPRIDFVYTWVNGSQDDFRNTKHPYELNSTLNDQDGEWVRIHGENRYRDWDELRYSVRSVEKYAPFKNKIQLLVNALATDEGAAAKQVPTWLDVENNADVFEVLAQESYFEDDKKGCLPTFNSISIENQLYNTKSGVDRLFALSDDMLLGRPHAASDMYSPLFGPLIAFKTNTYNTLHKPNEADAKRFGEKPWLIYTSWLLNRRFGSRKRKGQAHFGHSLSRRITREAMRSFPGPELQSACSRFRGDFGFQLYAWYATFHYTIERHREVLLWSYLMHRSDPDQDGYLSSDERQQIMTDLEEGLENESKSSFRARNFYHYPDLLEDAGLEPPKVNLDIIWTSMDGPAMIKDADCFEFDVNECLAPGFSLLDSYDHRKSPIFSTAAVFDRVARQQPECGDCLIKILLHRVTKGFGSLLPNNATQPKAFEIVVKALMRYQYVINEPDGLFVMVTDAEQVETTLIKRLLTKKKKVGQLCLNDDVSSDNEDDILALHSAMKVLFEGLQPNASRFELDNETGSGPQNAVLAKFLK